MLEKVFLRELQSGFNNLISACEPCRTLRNGLIPILIFVFSISINNRTYSQCNPVCFAVNVALGADCVDTLNMAMLNPDVGSCVGPFLFELHDAAGNPLGTDIINASMINQPLQYSVTDASSGLSCWTTITIEDGAAPIMINCPPDDTISCYTPLDSVPQLTDVDVMDCSDFTITFSDDILYNDSCTGFRSEIVRTYRATDIYGNVDSCVQRISIELPTLADVQFPPNFALDSSLICEPGVDTSPVNTGYPMIDGIPIVNGTFCNLFISRTDAVSETWNGGYKILRTWSVADWCLGGASIDSQQVIEVKDTTPPSIIAPGDITVGVSSTSCSADIVLDPAIVSDYCSSIIIVQVDGPMGSILSNGGPVSDLPIGTHEFIYTARDDCSNQSYDTMRVTVIDDVVPVTSCNSYRFIPVGSDGCAVLSAQSFDNGSFDQCSSVYFKVRRMTPPTGYDCFVNGNDNYQFDDEIKFCCGDIANNNIMVILRVYDVDPGMGIVSDAHLAGRFNDCMIEVEVQDKLAPQITCPPNLTISCNYVFDPNNLSVFGDVVTNMADQDSICITDPDNPFNPNRTCYGMDGLATDNCNVSVMHSSQMNIDSCGEGNIIRTFTATDSEGRTSICVQEITVINFIPFTANDIDWPDNYSTNVCNASLDPDDIPVAFRRPILDDDICDLVGSSYEDDAFLINLNGEACKKVLRNWKVVNWCNATFDSISGATTYPTWTHQQILMITNSVKPVITSGCEPLTLCSDDDACGPGNVTLTATATDDCTPTSELIWSYVIDANNDGSFDISGVGNDASGLYPIGNHRLLWTVEDRCGNRTTCEKLFTVEDCKLPSPYCHDGLSIALMPQDTDGDGVFDAGMVPVWAKDFDRGSYHVCGNDITISFSEDPADSSRIFTCDDVGINTVQIWVIDEFGNKDFCTTHIDIQNNTGIINCDPVDACEIDVDVSSSVLVQGCQPTREVEDESTYSSPNVQRNWTILKDDFSTPAVSGTDFIGFINGTLPTSNPINIELIPTGSPGGIAGFDDLDANNDEGTIVVQLESSDDMGCFFKSYQTLINLTCSGACDGFGCGELMLPEFGDPRILNSTNTCWLRIGGIRRNVFNGERWFFWNVQFGSLDTIPDDASITLSKNGNIVYTQTGVDLVTGWHRFSDGEGITPGTVWEWNVNYTTAFCNKGINRILTEPAMVLGATISGQVENEDLEKVGDVEIHLDGSNLPPIMTTDDGTFSFPEMPFGSSYEIRPFKDNEHMNGISTYDIVLIQKHLLGVHFLDSPEKIIAADVNHSENISALDLIELRKLILGINSNFPNNTSWRFVDSNFEYPDINNPFATDLPETYKIDDLIQDMIDIDFTAIKVGDVNGSVNLAGFNSGTPRNGKAYILMENTELHSDQELSLPFKISNLNSLLGAQFELRFDPEFIQIQDVILTDVSNQSNFSLQNLERGRIAFSWNTDSGQAIDEVANLFELKIKAIKDVQLKDVLSIVDRSIQAEAYYENNSEVEIKGLHLQFFENDNREDFELFQNKPNPFKEQTIVTFFLPENANLSLQVYDINGRLIYNESSDYSKGMNEIELSTEKITRTSGIFYYKIQSDKYSATKRMIIVE